MAATQTDRQEIPRCTAQIPGHALRREVHEQQGRISEQPANKGVSSIFLRHRYAFVGGPDMVVTSLLHARTSRGEHTGRVQPRLLDIFYLVYFVAKVGKHRLLFKIIPDSQNYIFDPFLVSVVLGSLVYFLLGAPSGRRGQCILI